MSDFDLIVTEFNKSNKVSKRNNKSKSVSNPIYLWNVSGVFKDPAEQDAQIIIPVLLNSHRYEELVDFISILLRSIILNTPSQNKSYKTYAVTFIYWLQDVVLSASRKNSPSKKSVNLLSTLCGTFSNSSSLTQTQENNLKSVLSSKKVYFHKTLFDKFKSRLRCQDRVSGDKVWLPLRFIAKIYKSASSNKNDFKDWLDDLTKDVYVHYDKNGNICSQQIGSSNEVMLDLELNTRSTYDVYVIWKSKGQRERVWTPTGNGNQKKEMTVGDIPLIDIDHVKPIDLTLRDLSNKNLIPQLTKISDEYKRMQDQISQGGNASTIESSSIAKLSKSIKFDDLKKELNKLKKDGKLRLMDSTFNESKSKSLTFQAIYTYGNKYYGKMGEAINSPSSPTPDVVIYQDLSENGVTRIANNTVTWHNPKNEVPIKKVPLECI